MVGAILLSGSAEGVQVDPLIVVPIAVVVVVLAVLLGRYARQAQRGRAHSGAEGLVGRLVELRDVRDGHGRAFLEGTWWSTRTAGPPLPEGAIARVVDLDGLTLVVEPPTEGDDS